MSQLVDSKRAAPQGQARAQLVPPRIRVPWRRLGDWCRRGLQFALVCGVAYGVVSGTREAYEYATTSPRFEARSLIFEPTAHIDDARLRELLALESGTNILAIDLDQLRVRIAADPWVADIELTRMLPDTLAVRVTERVAAAAILAESFYLVDERGVPFKRASPAELVGLTVISGIDRNVLSQLRDQAVNQVSFALGVMSQWHAKRRPELGEVHLGEDGNLSLYLAEGGAQLRLGRAEPGRAFAKFDRLRSALGPKVAELSVVHLDDEDSIAGQGRVVVRYHERVNQIDDETDPQHVASADAVVSSVAASSEASAARERTQGQAEIKAGKRRRERRQ